MPPGEGAQGHESAFRLPEILNNLDWLGRLSYIDVLRDVGKHFSVNMMIQKDSVRDRLHGRDQGISYTEFSYMILQAYDFLHLHRDFGVTLQMGGSDQFGNIVAGCDLIRRDRVGDDRAGVDRAGDDRAPEAFGLTAPLVTKADGTKFGKTESGAVWLTAPRPGEDSPARTSVYGYYQFWLNASDADVGRYLRIFTLLPRPEIEAIEAAHAADPGRREAQRALARAATDLLHGRAERDRAEAAAAALFSGDLAAVPVEMLDEVLAGAPATDHPRDQLGAGVPLAELLPLTTLAKSKREAKELLEAGSISVNGRRATADQRVTPADLLHGRVLALRRGKKTWHVTRWS